LVANIPTPILRGGKYGIFLKPLPENKQREMINQLFELLRPMVIFIFACKVLDQQARNRAIIIVSTLVNVPIAELRLS